MSSNSANTEPARCEFQANLSSLRQTLLFGALPLETQKLLAYLCERQHFDAGVRLFQQGEDDGQAYLLIEGWAELLRGKDQTECALWTCQPGAFFGALSLFGRNPRLFSLKALSDVTALVLTRDRFVKVMDRYPELYPRIVSALVAQIYDWERRILTDSDQDCPLCRTHVGVSSL